MALQNLPHLQGLLNNENFQINPPNQMEIQVVDRIYAKAYEHFRITTVFSIIYSILKVGVTPFLIGFTHFPRQVTKIWFFLLLAISFIQIFYYFKARNFSKNMQVFLTVAEKMRHSAYFLPGQVSQQTRRTRVHEQIYSFQNPGAQPNDRQFRMLALQVKFYVLNEQTVLKISSKVLFFLYQALHIWGFVIFLTQSQQSPASDIMIVILFLGTYQYFEFYSLVIIVVIIAPFLLIYLGIKSYRKKVRQEAIARRLEGSKFDPLILPGDHTCNICMDEYKEQDMITTLQCNQLHHFHQHCLAEWVRVANTCPMCRQPIEN